MQDLEEPKGISFFNVKSGDTHYARLEPTIAAYINSSDMGINASRGQDFGWRLGKEWVERVRRFRRDTTQMSILTARNGGQRPTTVQILYHLYGEELRAYQEEQEEHEAPFEDEYLESISARTDTPAAPQEVDEIPEIVDEADLMPADDPQPSINPAVDDTPGTQTREAAPASERVEEVQGDKPTKTATRSQKKQ